MRLSSAPLPSALITQVETTANGQPGWLSQSYTCRLVTPMYGGGVKPGEVDREMPIRASAIRGQLRFWWRLVCAQNLSAAEMFRREEAIWGGLGDKAPTASKVKVRITNIPVITETEFVSSSSQTHPAMKYAFGSAAINGPVDWLKAGYQFQLQLCCADEFSDQIETTLRWWASFGGLGARTRRGFGAVHLESIAPVTDKEAHAFGARMVLLATGGKNAEPEWEKSIDRLYTFRQAGAFARRPGRPRPGRSYWPEPDQLRRFTRLDGNGKHPPEHSAGNVFPRAAFGLPITFEFKGTPGEPPKMELLPEGDSDRMASPLILRPYWDGKNWRAAALLLPRWEDALRQRLRFKDGDHYKPECWPDDPSLRQQLADMIQPMKDRDTDPLSAFMAFFAENK